MKNRIEQRTKSVAEQAASEDIVARFGEATLVRVHGRILLRGGSMADRMEALEWMAVFMPDAVACLTE